MESCNKFIFTWNIVNFSSCALQNGEKLVSPIVLANNLNESRWFLSLYPRGNRNVDSEYISLDIIGNDVNDAENDLNIDFIIDIINDSGQILLCQKENHFSFNLINTCSFYQLMKNSEILNGESTANDSITIRCSFTSQTIKHVAECAVRTKIGVDCCSFKWCLNQFDSFTSSKRNFFCNQMYEIEFITAAQNDEYKIKIRRIGQIYHVPHFLTGRFVLLDIDGCEKLSKKTKHFFGGDWEFPLFFTKSFLLAERNTYVKNNTFTLLCDFSVSVGAILNEVDYTQYNGLLSAGSSFSMDPVNALKEDFRRLLSCQEKSDVTLRVDGETFPAHTLILSARSPVFSTMFKQNMLEKQTGVVDIPDLDAETLRSLLIFLYTASLDDLNDERALNLLLAADKYQVLSLKEKCSSFLVSALSANNVCDILLIADRIGHVHLKKSAVVYIKTHSSACVNIFGK